MTESEAQKVIKYLPTGSRLELIKSDGSVIEVVLASHETHGFERKEYNNLVVPEMPPALLVQGKRWGVFRIVLDEIVNIAHVAKTDD